MTSHSRNERRLQALLLCVYTVQLRFVCVCVERIFSVGVCRGLRVGLCAALHQRQDGSDKQRHQHLHSAGGSWWRCVGWRGRRHWGLWCGLRCGGDDRCSSGNRRHTRHVDRERCNQLRVCRQHAGGDGRELGVRRNNVVGVGAGEPDCLGQREACLNLHAVRRQGIGSAGVRGCCCSGTRTGKQTEGS